MATVFVPSLMRDLTGGAARVDVPGGTVRQVVESLEAAYPGTRARLVDGDRLKPEIGVAVDGVMSRLGLRQQVGAQSEVHFLPAVSGGASPSSCLSSDARQPALVRRCLSEGGARSPPRPTAGPAPDGRAG